MKYQSLITALILLAALLTTTVWRITAQPLPKAPSASTTIIYNYDAAGRLIGAAYADGDAITYSYDNNGNLLQRVIDAGAVSAVVLQQQAAGQAPIALWLLVSLGLLGGATLVALHRRGQM